MLRRSRRERKSVVRHDATDELDDDEDNDENELQPDDKDDKEDDWSNNLSEAPESSEESLEEDGGGDDADDNDDKNKEDVKKPTADLDQKKRKKNCHARVVQYACSKDGLVPLSARIKKKKKKEFAIDQKVEALPAHTRKTTHGGYAHTNQSKSRISESNSGNTPWNYGKQRSSADKAKIAAGVRARNRTKLLEKLEGLGMSEEEFNKKRKEIRSLRERLRKAKLTNQKSETELQSKKLQEALDATDVTKQKEIKARLRDEEKKKREEERNKIQDERAKKIFSERMIWRPDNNNISSSYDEACIDDGPGGLICCEDCSSKYNAYLTSTMDDVETQRMNKGTQEVTEILDILNEKKDMLKVAADSAKMKIPPLPPPGMRIMNYAQENNNNNKVAGSGAGAPRPRPNGSGKLESNTNNKYDYDNMNSEIDINVGSLWNLTSSIDIGITGGIASI